MTPLMEFRIKGLKRLVLLSILLAQALVLSIIESWIPVPVPVPGVKLGLANIIILITIIFLGFKDAVFVVVLRTVLTSIYAGGPVLFMFSAAGGLLSTAVMAVLYNRASRIFGLIGISIAGALFHNAGQLLVAMIVMDDTAVFYFMPVLAVSAVIMGSFTGLIVSYLSQKLERISIIRKD